jgi:urease accessory protein
MPDLPPARSLLPTAPATCHDLVVLTYDERLIRRKRLTTVHDESFLVDLPAVTNLDDFWGFQLDDGRTIQVVAAEESLLEITVLDSKGADLPRLSWHIGNRHTPCQVEATRLLIRRDHVLENMLRHLGAQITLVTEPFTPEGGAYGTGRTMGHDHGGHAHGPDTPPHAHEESFGWHDHGDGKMHFHAPKR